MVFLTGTNIRNLLVKCVVATTIERPVPAARSVRKMSVASDVLQWSCFRLKTILGFEEVESIAERMYELALHQAPAALKQYAFVGEIDIGM